MTQNYISLSAIAKLATGIALTIAGSLIHSTPAHSQQPTFACDNSSGVPATVVQSPQHGAVKIIEWKTTEFGSKFNPQVRCDAVSQKFQKYAEAGTLKYFTTGLVNRQPVICAVASESSPCNSESMLYTLKKGSNPNTTLKRLLDVRSGASSSALNETGNRIYIDFDRVVEAKAQNNVVKSSSNIESAPLF